MAGGCVRDFLLRRTPNDLDIVTNATPEQMEKIFERVIPVGKEFGVLRIPHADQVLEVATFRSDGDYQDGRRPTSVTFSSPQEDATRRDFTVNAMFLDPTTFEVFDYVNGKSDLHARILRAVGVARVRFEEDHLRVLRAIRFVSQLGFKMDAATQDAVNQCAHLVMSVSGERVQEEMKKLWQGAYLADTRTHFIKSDLFKWFLGLDEEQALVLQHWLLTPTAEKIFTAAKPQGLRPLDRWVLIALHLLFLLPILPVRLKWSKEDKTIFNRAVAGLVNGAGFAQARDIDLLKTRDSVEGPTVLRCLQFRAGDDPLSQAATLRFESIATRWPKTPAAVVNGDDLIKTGMAPGAELARALDQAFELQLQNSTWSKTELLNAISAFQKK